MRQGFESILPPAAATTLAFSSVFIPLNASRYLVATNFGEELAARLVDRDPLVVIVRHGHIPILPTHAYKVWGFASRQERKKTLGQKK